MTNIVGIVGSLRKSSYNRALMNAFIKQAPSEVSIHVAEISDLPFYNEDVEENAIPETVQGLKNKIEVADAVIIATPEYNRGTSGVLKNAIDWLSRPSGQNSLKEKLVLIIGASTGARGADVAQYDLKRTLLYMNARVMGQPEFFLGLAKEKFDDEGNLIDE
ncbi:MAG: NAD(P)H-dependent oxidoreductase, partial [Candidatus Paceibacterota bacterium]